MLQRSLRRPGISLHLLVVALTLVGAALLGRWPSPALLLLLLGGAGASVLTKRPDAGYVVLVFAAYSVPLEVGLGNAFAISAVHLLLPALALFWSLGHAGASDAPLVTSGTFRPLGVFLIAATVSWLYGNVTWDPRFPRQPDLLAIQAAQWTIYALSILAYLLASQQSHRAVRWTTFAFLGMGVFALIDRYGGSLKVIGSLLTASAAQTNGTFFVWMTALAAGQALFNQDLPRPWRRALSVVALSVPLLGLWQNTSWASSWLPALVVLGILLLLRSPTLGITLIGLTVVGLLLSPGSLPWRSVWESERSSVIGRSILWRAVVQLGLRQPVFGLGLTTYHQYHRFIPLLTERGRWHEPNISSHNLYIDLFAQLGVVGLGLFMWAVTEIGLLAWRLRREVRSGFDRAYVSSALAGLLGMLVASSIVEWLLPFAYNAGLRSLRFGVFSWVFLGYLVVIAARCEGRHAGEVS